MWCGSRPRRVSRRCREREGAGRPADDLAVDLGVGGVLAEATGLTAAVVVAGAGGQQAEVGGHGAQPGAGRGVVVHVVDLDAVETGRGEFGDRAPRYAAAALDGQRMREDGDPACRLDQPDRVERVELVLLHVRPAVVGEPLGGERVGDGGDHAQVDEGGGDVRPTDGPVPGDPGHLLPGDRHTEVPQLGDHALGPRHPVVPHQFPLAGELRLLGVEEVGEHMEAHPVEPAGEFGAGDQRQPPGQRRPRLGVPADGVVVGQRDDVQAGGRGIAHQLGGGVRTVGGRGVGVQIDTHDADSRLLRDGRGTGPGKHRVQVHRKGTSEGYRAAGYPPARPDDAAGPPRRAAAGGPHPTVSRQPRIRGDSAPHGSRSTSAPASRRSVSTSSSYISSPDCSGQAIAQSHSPRASPAKTARSGARRPGATAGSGGRRRAPWSAGACRRRDGGRGRGLRYRRSARRVRRPVPRRSAGVRRGRRAVRGPYRPPRSPVRHYGRHRRRPRP